MIIPNYIDKFKTTLLESNQVTLEGHILNFYEDHDMPLEELEEVIDAALTGELENVQEKMDGQNITFTVNNGELMFFNKGVSATRVRKGGMNRDTLQRKFQRNKMMQEAFVSAYDALSEVTSGFDDLFQGGTVVIESALIDPDTPNTILYVNPAIRFIRAVALSPEAQLSQEAFDRFVEHASNSQGRYHMGLVPHVLRRADAISHLTEATALKHDLRRLAERHGLTIQHTVGDLSRALIRFKLCTYDCVPERLREAAVDRLLLGRGELARKYRALGVSPQRWKEFQRLDKNRATFVAEALIPMEEIIQKLGAYTFRNLEFTMTASNHEQLRLMMEDVRAAYEQDRIQADSDQMERIRVALARMRANQTLFESPVEGIVFDWRGRTRKLTGMFTAINKLRGLFRVSGLSSQDLGRANNR